MAYSFFFSVRSLLAKEVAYSFLCEKSFGASSIFVFCVRSLLAKEVTYSFCVRRLLAYSFCVRTQKSFGIFVLCKNSEVFWHIRFVSESLLCES